MTNITFASNLPTNITENVRVILKDAISRSSVDATEVCEVDVVDAMEKFNAEGPYDMAKRLGLLKNNNAEDMAIEFMTFVNQMFPNSY